MFMQILFLLIGFVFLVKGADWFVEGSSAIAHRMGIASIVIGLTIVAFGTSAPEAAVSIAASLQGNTGIAVGNVLGSNIFNLLVVTGAAALIKTVGVHDGIIRRDLPYSILAAAVLLVLGFDGKLSRIDGLVLLLMMAYFMYYTFRSIPKQEEETDENADLLRPSAGQAVVIAVVGLVGIILGGQMVVDSASALAVALGVSQAVIGLTIVAVGTSLPELVTSAVAARKGESDIAIGNVVGSNIFNILSILAISSIVSPLGFAVHSLWDCAILIALSLVAWGMAVKNKTYGKIAGAVGILTYVAYTAYILVR